MQKIKKRNMFIQVLLMVVTFGLYQTKDEEAAPTLWLILFVVPLGIFYSYFKYCELYAKICSEKIDKWILFLVWFFFAPAIWFLVQTDLNRLSESATSSTVT